MCSQFYQVTLGIIACVDVTTTTTGTTPQSTTTLGTSALPTTTLGTSALPTTTLGTSALPTTTLGTSALPTTTLGTSALPTTTLGTSALPTTTSPPTTSALTSTTTTLSPTTTTMNYCILEGGMNQPLTIQPGQMTSNPSPSSSQPSDINPTSTTPGLSFSKPTPQINITIVKETTITFLYIPTDRPNQSTNVKQFVVVFVFPNNTRTPDMPSTVPSTSATTTTTTTPATGASSATTTTPSTSAIVPPSDRSPQVDLPANFQVPAGTIIIITIISTTDQQNPTGVCNMIFYSIFT